MKLLLPKSLRNSSAYYDPIPFQDLPYSVIQTLTERHERDVKNWVTRNSVCVCNSRKRFKNCCGKKEKKRD